MTEHIPRILVVGATVKDSVYFSGRPLATVGGKFNFSGRKTYTGGSGANASIAAAQLGFTQGIQAEVILVSKIGDGIDESQPTKKKILRRGVSILDAIASHEDHDIPVNTVESGSDDRRILVDGSHEYPDIDAGFADKLRKEMRKGVDEMQIHTRIPDLALLATELAYDENIPFAVDASNHDKTLDEILPYTTYGVLPDELKLSGMDPNSDPDPQAILDYMKAKGVPYAAVMCGDKDTIYDFEGQIGTVPVYSGDGFKMTDKLGAGDAARGAMLIAMASGHRFEDAIQYANLIGTYSCAYYHRQWIDKLKEHGKSDLQRITGYVPESRDEMHAEALMKAL